MTNLMKDMKVSCVLEAQGQFHSLKTKERLRLWAFYINRIDENERRHFWRTNMEGISMEGAAVSQFCSVEDHIRQ